METLTSPAAFPRCRNCGEGDLVPLSDFGGQGASVDYKAWVCTNPECGYNLKIRNGEVIRNEPIIDASAPQAAAPPRLGRPSGLRTIR